MFTFFWVNNEALEDTDFLPHVNYLSLVKFNIKCCWSFSSIGSFHKYLLSAYNVSSREAIAVNKHKTASMEFIFWVVYRGSEL